MVEHPVAPGAEPEDPTVWVKVCGLTTAEDALMSVAMGADAVGFVFAPSPRQVAPGRVREITRQLPPEIITVGVFRDQAPQQVVDAMLTAGLQVAQLHGHESPADAAEIRRKVSGLIVAFAAADSAVERYDEYGADALLLDAASPGSGRVFDWSLAHGVPSNRRLILAGGLDPDNVADAIAAVRPWGVDVSSGVESSKGVKDLRKVRDFVKAARSVPASHPAHRGRDGRAAFDWAEVADG